MIEKYHKEIISYHEAFCVLVPVWYEYELKPAWRKFFIGTKKECESAFVAAPDHIIASYEENKRARYYKLQELLFYRCRGDNKKADAIKAQYNF